MGQKIGLLTASQRQRIEVAEMKLLRPLAGYTFYDHTTNNYICRNKLQIKGIIDKINKYRWNWFQNLDRMPQNRIPLKSYYYNHKEGEQLEDQRNAGESICNFGDENGSVGPILDVYIDIYIYIYIFNITLTKIVY